ncbi:hypothetical protein GQ44DRAFT_701470 [Phaeosphaeriaceae sp. PMI808]|nr:hypothetical protein GQ44DRAFT_701470 [Phaeosphaeriaceae sp. PMI808]
MHRAASSRHGKLSAHTHNLSAPTPFGPTCVSHSFILPIIHPPCLHATLISIGLFARPFRPVASSLPPANMIALGTCL